MSASPRATQTTPIVDTTHRMNGFFCHLSATNETIRRGVCINTTGGSQILRWFITSRYAPALGMFSRPTIRCLSKMAAIRRNRRCRNP
jgi:hypothetical protein